MAKSKVPSREAPRSTWPAFIMNVQSRITGRALIPVQLRTQAQEASSSPEAGSSVTADRSPSVQSNTSRTMSERSGCTTSRGSRTLSVQSTETADRSEDETVRGEGSDRDEVDTPIARRRRRLATPDRAWRGRAPAGDLSSPIAGRVGRRGSATSPQQTPEEDEELETLEQLIGDNQDEERAPEPTPQPARRPSQRSTRPSKRRRLSTPDKAYRP
jgi:hypothetical protein